MEITATLKVINDVKSGVSATSGNEWKRQDIVLGWDEEAENGNVRHQLLMVTLHGESVTRFGTMNLKVGDEVSGRVDFSTRAYGGRVYNDIAMYV